MSNEMLETEKNEPPVEVQNQLEAESPTKTIKTAAMDLLEEEEPEEQDEVPQVRHASDIYDFGQALGRGAFGRVYEAVFKPTGETIAVKVSDKS